MLAENIDTDIRQPDVIECSIVCLPLYENLNTKKIDTTCLDIPQTATMIFEGTVQKLQSIGAPLRGAPDFSIYTTKQNKYFVWFRVFDF